MPTTDNGIRMNTFFSAVKALLLLLGLNAVLAMALAAFALQGMIALRLSLLLGVFFSADLLALLLFLKVRLTPEPRRGLARFFSARNCVLAFLLSGLAAGGFYYHAAVLSEHHCDSFREISPLLHSGAALRRLLPETASDIRFYENRISPLFAGMALPSCLRRFSRVCRGEKLDSRRDSRSESPGFFRAVPSGCGALSRRCIFLSGNLCGRDVFHSV